MGKKEGDVVVVKRPKGAVEVEVVAGVGLMGSNIVVRFLTV